MLVKAGDAVDSFIQQLVPHLEQGDIIIDGGNSYYPDSIRRTKELEAKGLLFVGSGVSGGEEGARYAHTPIGLAITDCLVATARA
jgi:6-phosphogluconate dehydrogenase